MSSSPDCKRRLIAVGSFRRRTLEGRKELWLLLINSVLVQAIKADEGSESLDSFIRENHMRRVTRVTQDVSRTDSFRGPPGGLHAENPPRAPPSITSAGSLPPGPAHPARVASSPFRPRFFRPRGFARGHWPGRDTGRPGRRVSHTFRRLGLGHLTPRRG
jgi:hypothetical protein